MKKTLCLLFALLFVLSSSFGLASCKKDEGGGGDEETTISTTGGDAANDPDAKLYARLPREDYDGYTFKVLNAQSNYALTDVVPVETQDSLSQAMVERNSMVKALLNINLVEESRPYPSYTTVQDEVRKLNSTQDFVYDVVFNECAAQTPLAQEGAYLTIDDYEAYLNLKNPWWFNDAMNSLKIDGRTCELFGDFHLMYYESIDGMTFNQKKFSDNKVEFPYDLVREGKWTMAEFKEMVSIFNSNSPEPNNYGVVAPRSFSTAMITASNFSLVEQDETDILKTYDNDETLIKIYTDVMSFYVSNGDGKANWIHPEFDSEAYSSGAFAIERALPNAARSVFQSGRAAFMVETIGGIRTMRQSEFDYGIIPVPKYDTDQRKYVSPIYAGAAPCGVPTTSPDLERTCTILENLAAYSYKFVKKEYYEIVVQLRTVRDNDSIEMLDIIFGHSDMSTTRFELDEVYGLGLSTCIRINLSDARTEVKSQLDSIKNTEVKSNIQKVIDAYKD